MNNIRILGLSGSLRLGSLNTALLRAAVELAPTDIHIDIYEGLGDLPLYNADLDHDQPPEAVRDLRERIAGVDALLVATPEYNYSIPGVLKNALDWASRPVGTSVLRHKPVASMGAAPGNMGTVRAQLALRDVWLWTESIPVGKPEVHVFRALERFDGEGRLVDEMSRQLVTQLLEALRENVYRGRQVRVQAAY
jgi:chromate reductase